MSIFENKKLLDINQLAEILNVRPRTIHDWKYKGLIPYVKLGKLLRFDPERIQKWLKAKEGKGIARNKIL